MSRNRSRNRSDGFGRSVAIFLVIILLLGMIGGGVFVCIKSNVFRDWSYFKGENTQTDPDDVPPKDVTDDEGEDLESGTVYKLPRAMVYARTSAQSLTASDGITVEAKVSPTSARDKSIDWTIKYATDSEWAQAHPLDTVLSVTPEKDGSTRANIKCLSEFAEQIIITATSRAKPEYFDTCTVDFAQRVESVSLNIGNFPVNLNGDTSVNVDLGTSTGDVGGKVTLTYHLSEVYTLAETITENVTFGMETSGVGDYVYSIENMGASGSSYDRYTKPEGIGSEIYFDLRLFSDYEFVHEGLDSNLQSTRIEWSENIPYVENQFNTWKKDKIFWTVTVSLSGQWNNYEVQSHLRWTGIQSSVNDVTIVTPSDKTIIL